ncbi:MAG: GMP synthase [Candidatus Desulfovibrio kirbyi]|uniref:GMP synthase [glutamine-hydrolyzing] n=1 Tax=Candidatus Desulfovibrio kirbyi TaxID=2696086 RepID=A0A6L2R5J7_9BACT|nr:MAG: GMP synthase [Candidatus Desulfovibrio kirbyi]
MPLSKVVIIDYGSQVTQLIARRVREAGIYSEIHSCATPGDQIAALRPSALILSGGPASVGEEDAPTLDPTLLTLGVPVLGICYGMQLLAHHLGGQLAKSLTREYGPADLRRSAACTLWDGLDKDVSRVWMSHGDKVLTPPPDFTVTGSTPTLDVTAMANEDKKIYAVQFHPEVHHSVDGVQMLRNFLFKAARLTPDWTMASFVDRTIQAMAEQIGDRHVVCALSGGIDSTVVAVLLNHAIGKRLHCIFVDNGLLRLNEGEEVPRCMREHFNLNLTVVQAQDRFLSRLKGVDDPEQKRKIIGRTFIEIFDEEASKLPQVDFLAQGTLYPDIIESVSHKGPSAVIKSHHNVGGLPETMNLKLVEPLRELFKDEVRKVAAQLNMPDSIVWRQPFPGPGLAIRILGAVTEQRLYILRKADNIVQQELRDSGWYTKVWQGFAVLLPLKTVGVMGDQRTYEHIIALRIVDSVDAMTADWTRLPPEIIERMSGRIISEVKGVNRVVYDVSSKPPSTIEWE